MLLEVRYGTLDGSSEVSISHGYNMLYITKIQYTICCGLCQFDSM